MQLKSIIATISAFFVLHSSVGVVSNSKPAYDKQLLAKREYSLDDRYGNKFVNDVFKDNILLDLAYLSGKVKRSNDINWDEIHKPFSYQFVLKPGEVFAFHDSLLSQFQGKTVKTTNAHFDSIEGFRSDGYLYGDGVCHLASFINWVAKDANLAVVAPTRHDFAKIPDVPPEYGVAIYASPEASFVSAEQNLYVQNNHDAPIVIAFDYQNDTLGVSIYKQ